MYVSGFAGRFIAGRALCSDCDWEIRGPLDEAVEDGVAQLPAPIVAALRELGPLHAEPDEYGGDADHIVAVFQAALSAAVADGYGWDELSEELSDDGLMVDIDWADNHFAAEAGLLPVPFPDGLSCVRCGNQIVRAWQAA
jgi:hypothetical protein